MPNAVENRSNVPELDLASDPKAAKAREIQIKTAQNKTDTDIAYQHRQFGGDSQLPKAFNPYDPNEQKNSELLGYGQGQGMSQHAGFEEHPALDSNQLAGVNPDNQTVDPSQFTEEDFEANEQKVAEQLENNPQLQHQKRNEYVHNPAARARLEQAPTSTPTPNPLGTR